MKFNWT